MSSVPKHSQRSENHEAILEAMGRLMERMGYNKTTIEDIAQEVGIGKGSIYLYFESKSDIALEWMERMHEDLAKELLAISLENKSPEERIVLLLKRRVLYRYDRFLNHCYSIEQMLATLRKEMSIRKERFHNFEAKVLADVLLEIGGDCEQDASPSAQAMIRATNSLLPYSHRVSDMDGREAIEVLVERMAQLMTEGYKSKYGRTRPKNK